MKKFLSKVIIIVMMLIIIYEMFIIYGMYVTQKKISSNSNINPWKIYVNKQDITVTQNFSINDLETEGTNVVKGKIAPGSIIVLPLEIDATKTKSKVRYEVTVDIPSETLKIGNFNIENNMETNNSDSLKYIGYISKEENERNIKRKEKIKIKWTNDEENNVEDTKLATESNRKNINFNVTVSVTQERE